MRRSLRLSGGRPVRDFGRAAHHTDALGVAERATEETFSPPSRQLALPSSTASSRRTRHWHARRYGPTARLADAARTAAAAGRAGGARGLARGGTRLVPNGRVAHVSSPPLGPIALVAAGADSYSDSVLEG